MEQERRALNGQRKCKAKKTNGRERRAAACNAPRRIIMCLTAYPQVIRAGARAASEGR